MRRSRLDVKMDVLKKVAERPIGFSWLFTLANVNNAKLTQMLSVFERNGIVEITREDKGRKRPYKKQISITAKGLRVLRLHRSLIESLGESHE